MKLRLVIDRGIRYKSKRVSGIVTSVSSSKTTKFNATMWKPFPQAVAS